MSEAPPLTVAQAAELAGVHQKTIRRAIDRGDLPARRPGGRRKIVVLEEDLLAWRDAPVVPRNVRTAPPAMSAAVSRRPSERGSLAALRAIERSR
ncbi:MAG TPA: helix-turn-helix domain-containing protein [Solirubrobacteraceae bacterium]|nr:helix-turn-helix domain-containing protein [Solirubrobacteraceae bacterium]